MSEINPAKQTVYSCLNRAKYKIDFYQREYVWSKKTVETLLDDIFYSFEQSYSLYKDAEMTEDVLNKFGWYYLNVIMISKEGSVSYIVDGQQRLTTLVLLCSKLFLMSNEDKVKALLKECIYGTGFFTEEYYLDHDKRKRAMDSIIKSEDLTVPYTSPTEKNLIDRYNDISEYIDKKGLSGNKLFAFSYYVLYKLVLIELEIGRYEDTPMIFEVINDRGEALRPFEILKGKLVGALQKTDSQKYSDKWDDAVNRLDGNEDKFFSTLIKARWLPAKNTADEALINNAYQRYLFDDNEVADALGFRKQDKNRIENIKTFIDETLTYYSKLYKNLLESVDINMRYCREIIDTESPYQLILAACDIDDGEEDKKISTICREVDRLYMLLRLNGVYESQRYQDIVYDLSGKLKQTALDDYRVIFNEAILQEIKEKQAVLSPSLLDYTAFKKLRYNTSTYFYYLFARIEDYICSNTNQSPQNDVFYMSTKHSAKNGYHIEHIFSDNQTNRAYYKDDETFNEQRNGVGGLLLLKGADNISSGNEEYTDKLQTYSHGPVWGHTLCEEFYNSNVDFKKFNDKLKQDHNVEFKSYPDKFTPDNMEERCQLVYELVKEIWDIA